MAEASKSDKHRQTLERLQVALESMRTTFEQLQVGLKESEANILQLTKKLDDANDAQRVTTKALEAANEEKRQLNEDSTSHLLEVADCERRLRWPRPRLEAKRELRRL
ncbi:hypothetical protein Adt_45729 [Abeliophyllum distichum]|uniref:Uncharacterized protein n=1 Tax=Abeliophyllum distichum TaxID=126358 RepID=A0ABD1PGZ5_9LAMI